MFDEPWLARMFYKAGSYGLSFAFTMYKSVASLYGVGSSAAKMAGVSGFLTGFSIGVETEKGLNNPNPAKYIKQKTIKEIMEY